MVADCKFRCEEEEEEDEEEEDFNWKSVGGRDLPN